MGTWGIKIEQDDFVKDIIGDFKDFLKMEQNIKKATIETLKKYNAYLDDEDDDPLIWLALAKCQWEYGDLDLQILSKVKKDFLSEKGLRRWQEESEDILAKRKKEIEKFISKLENKNEKPKKYPKLTVRKPLFQEGDCLSIKLDSGYYGAAVVLKYDHSNIEYGKNLIINLDYYNLKEPTQSDFKNMTFLERSDEYIKNLKIPSLNYYKKQGYHNYKYYLSWFTRLGFRKFSKNIIKIDNIDVTNYKDLNSNATSNWGVLLSNIERHFESE